MEDLLDSAKTGNIQGCGYAAMLAFAVQGDEADKLGSLFTIFDTSNKGKLEQRTLKVLSGAVSFISQNFSNDSGGLDMSTANAPAVSADEFVGFCTSNDAVTKIIQRAFLAILKVPPKSSGVASQYAQQATLARRRVDSLRTKKARTEEERARKELDSLKRKMTEKERELMRAASLVEIEESRDENSTDGAGTSARHPSLFAVPCGLVRWGVASLRGRCVRKWCGENELTVLLGQRVPARVSRCAMRTPTHPYNIRQCPR